jgi:hypothetical protein
VGGGELACAQVTQNGSHAGCGEEYLDLSIASEVEDPINIDILRQNEEAGRIDPFGMMLYNIFPHSGDGRGSFFGT